MNPYSIDENHIETFCFVRKQKIYSRYRNLCHTGIHSHTCIAGVEIEPVPAK
jgi:hypothetical protein